MARVVCQVLVRPDRLTFLWSEGPASFEPYHKTGTNLHDFRELTRRVHDLLRRLPDAAAAGGQGLADTGLALAHAGHDLYQQLFRADDGQADLAHEIRNWLVGLDRQGALERLEVVSDVDEPLPWSAVHDSPPDEGSFRAAAGTPEGWHGFWGARLNLTSGRRVSPLHSRPVFEEVTALLAIDPSAREQLSAEGRERLEAAARASGMAVVESVAALTDSLRTGRPDILYLFCRVSGHTLLLGGDVVTAGELREALGADAPVAGARSDTFVFLNACRGPGGEDGADVLDLVGAVGTRATLAPRVPLPAEAANRFGVELLTGLVARGERLGRLLLQLRSRAAPLGLLYAACAPPELRVDLNAGDERDQSAIQAEERPGAAPEPEGEELEPLSLPETPYFPLAPYDIADRALFIGREDDTDAFAEALDEPGVRLLVLHGASGVGKGSLLRAGVVPFLEENGVGYQALRNRAEDEDAAADAGQDEGEAVAEEDYPVAMIRATGDLAGQLAIALLDYCARPYIYTTPTGRNVEVDLPQILSAAVGWPAAAASAIKEPAAAVGEAGAAPGGPPPLPEQELDPETLRTALRRDLRLLGRLLAALAERLPHELVLFVERGEEMFTLAGGGPDGSTRLRGLAMLRRLADTPGRARVVLSLRTEFHGRLLSQLQQGPADVEGLRSYLLEPLDEKALVEAVLAPTAVAPLADTAAAPFTVYRFVFEEGLPEQIVKTARRAAADRRQSAAALLQVVCARLAERVRGRADNVVRQADVVALGGVEEGLVRDFEIRVHSLPLVGRDRIEFRRLLARLVFHTSEGIPVSDLVAEDKLAKDWRGSSLLPALLEVAADARLVEVDWLDVGGQEGRYVSLGRDVLPPVVERASETTAHRQYNRARVADTLWIMIPLLILALVWGWTRMRATWAVEAEMSKLEAHSKKLAEEWKRSVGEGNETRWPVYAGTVSRAHDSLRAGDLLTARQMLLGLLPQPREQKQDSSEWFARGFEWYYLWDQLDGARHTLRGHLAPVGAVAVAADGKTLASADAAGTIKLWDADSGQIRATLKGHKGAVHALAFAPKAAVLASAGADGELRLWDAAAGAKGDYVPDGKALETLKGHKGAVNALAYAPDGKTLASGGEDGAIKLWDVSAAGKAKERATLTTQKGAVHALAYAPDGKTLAAGGAEPGVRLWDVSAEGKEKERDPLMGYAGPVRALAYAPDGKLLASGGPGARDGFDAGAVALWDTGTGKKLRALERVPAGVRGLAFADGQRLTVAGKDDAARLWDASTGRPGQPLRGHLGWVGAVACTPDGKTLVTGSVDGTVKLWDAKGPADRDVLRGHKGAVHAVAFAPDDKKLATAGADGLIKVWDVATGKEEHTLKGHEGAVRALAYAPDGKQLASAGADGTVRLWDVDVKAEKFGAAAGVFKGHKGAVNALVFAETGKYLASAGEDGTARLWGAAPAEKDDFGKEVLGPFRVQGPLRAVALLAPGRLAAAGDGPAIMVWELRGGPPVGSVLKGHTADVLALAAWPGTKGHLASAGADRTVKLWDVGERACLATLRGHSSAVGALAFSEARPPLLASGGWDGVVRLWNPALQAERFTLTAPAGPVQAVAVSSDQRTLATAGRDGTVRLWRGSR